MKSLCFVITVFSISLFGNAQKVKPLAIGETVPELPIMRILNYSKPTTTLSELNKGKLLILDFWATWCAPCVGSFPKLDSLKKKFRDKLQVVSVTSEKEDYVDLFLQKQKAIKGISTVSVVDDKILRAVFPHSALPHYVWLNEDGKVIAITRGDEVNEKNISDFFAGNLNTLAVKFDNARRINRAKPFFLEAAQITVAPNRVIYQKNDKAYQSILLKKVEGITPGARFREHSLTIENNSLKNLAAYVWGEGKLEFLMPNRTILNVKDTVLFTSASNDDYHTEWGESNIYSYELIVNDTTTDWNFKFVKAKEDLGRYYNSRGIEVKRQHVPVKVLALTRTTDEDKLKTKGLSKQLVQNAYYFKLSNGSMKEFTFFLIKNWQTKLPFQDESNYSDKIDIEINADMSNIEAVNKELDRYGLKIVEKEKPIDMIVITQK